MDTWAENSIGKYRVRRSSSLRHTLYIVLSWGLHVPAAFVLCAPQLGYILASNVQNTSLVYSVLQNTAMVYVLGGILDAMVLQRTSKILIGLHQKGLVPCPVRFNQLQAESQYILLVCVTGSE